jgi:membrane-bound serine protease (ClpP class)
MISSLKKLIGITLFLGLCLFIFPNLLAATSAKHALIINIDGAIGPASADFVVRNLQTAEKTQAEFVIIELNTPGGLDHSMRDIIKAILTSPLPVISYVAPSGARAASAGTYIIYASHFAAMAPGTNLGAATPVSIGGGFGDESKEKNAEKKPSTENQKAINDATAFIRSLAQLRGRNASWAEQAVTSAATLSAEEALKLQVINIVAPDYPSLLQQLNGKKIRINNKELVLNTANLKLNKNEPDWRAKFLAIITDPNIAYILLLIGMYGLFFEFFNPGFIMPGVVGVICLLVALYAFQLLPINYAGLALLVFGVAFMIAEAFVPSFGTLGLGGIIAFVIGSVLLMDKNTSGFNIAKSVILTVTLVTAFFFLFIIQLLIRSRRRPPASGSDQLIGMQGKIEIDQHHISRIRLLGELWQVKSEYPLHVGDHVIVIQHQGLTLVVKPLQQGEPHEHR